MKTFPKHRILATISVLLLLPFLYILLLNALPFIIINLPAKTWTLRRSDVIIVLGASTDKDGKPSPILRERVHTGVKLFKDGYGKYLIFTGAAAHNKFVEAEVMATQAREEGVPAECIILEPEALNTNQNAFNSVQIMQKHSWTSAVVVSTAAHLRRANLIFSHYPVTYCMVGSDDPHEWSLWDRILFDQREKYSILFHVLSNKGIAIGLKPEQAAQIPELAEKALENQKQNK